MPVEEAKTYISKIENEENIPICEAVVGILPEEQLSQESLRVYREFMRWSENRAARTQTEQWTARKRKKQTDLSIKMNDLHSRGIISDEVMILYGISGPLPERRMYADLAADKKQAIWEEKMSNTFGPHWRSRFTVNVTTCKEFDIEETNHNWIKEGF
jgi:hypothetical protein